MSVRVFFVWKNGTKNVSRTIFNENLLAMRSSHENQIELTKKLVSKTNYTQPIIYCSIDQKNPFQKNIWNGFL